VRCGELCGCGTGVVAVVACDVRCSCCTDALAVGAVCGTGVVAVVAACGVQCGVCCGCGTGVVAVGAVCGVQCGVRCSCGCGTGVVPSHQLPATCINQYGRTPQTVCCNTNGDCWFVIHIVLQVEIVDSCSFEAFATLNARFQHSVPAFHLLASTPHI